MRERQDDARLPEARRRRRAAGRAAAGAIDRRAAAAAKGARRRDAADLRPPAAPARAGPRHRPAVAKPACRRWPIPGAALVARRTRRASRSMPLPGASSLLLALAASGLNGQSFAFVGYLPVDGRSARRAHPRARGAVAARAARRSSLIETPYRNAALLAALLTHLQPATRLSVQRRPARWLVQSSASQRQRRALALSRSRRRTCRPDVPAVFRPAALPPAFAGTREPQARSVRARSPPPSSAATFSWA